MPLAGRFEIITGAIALGDVRRLQQIGWPVSLTRLEQPIFHEVLGHDAVVGCAYHRRSLSGSNMGGRGWPVQSLRPLWGGGAFIGNDRLGR